MIAEGQSSRESGALCTQRWHEHPRQLSEVPCVMMLKVPPLVLTSFLPAMMHAQQISFALKMSNCLLLVCCPIFKKNPHWRICLLILEREEGEKRERNIDRLPPLCAQTGGLNLQPFGLRDGAPTH